MSTIEVICRQCGRAFDPTPEAIRAGVPSRNGAAMSTAARRLARLEAEEWPRVHTLTPLQWLEQGYVTFTTLLPVARAEFLGLLYTVCDPIRPYRPNAPYSGPTGPRHGTPRLRTEGYPMTVMACVLAQLRRAMA